jgi:hypothetical protein
LLRPHRRLVAQGIWRADFGLGVSDALAQARKQLFLARPGSHQVKRMDRAPLADSIDTADPLLEPHRVPRQFQIDDDAAGLMEIEPLAGSIRSEKNSAIALRERPKHRGSVVAREAAVQNGRRLVERAGNVREGVPIFGKDDERIRRSIAASLVSRPAAAAAAAEIDVRRRRS